MQKNSQEFSMQEALRLAQSDAGQQLLNLLQQQNGTKLQQAIDQAARGDYDRVKQTMASLLANPEIRELLEKMGG